MQVVVTMVMTLERAVKKSQTSRFDSGLPAQFMGMLAIKVLPGIHMESGHTHPIRN